MSIRESFPSVVLADSKAALVGAAIGGAIILGLGYFAIAVTFTSTSGVSMPRPAESLVEVPNEPLQPVPPYVAVDQRKVNLGQRLFVDARLSREDNVACASCHRPDRGGADDAVVSLGRLGQSTDVNTPTVRNSAFSVAQFWDGRAPTLEDQIDGPLQNPREMGSNWADVIAKLKRDREYVALVREIYGTPLSPEAVKDAIAEYERSLRSSNSRFDAFLRGNAEALSGAERAGYELFKQIGCAACHQGVAVGGNTFQRFGLFGDYFGDRGGPLTTADLGRFNVTGRPEDRHVFKVPSLRDVGLTAPYFHDGSTATLEEAVTVMARYQLGRHLTVDQIASLAAFLRSLTGRLETSGD